LNKINGRYVTGIIHHGRLQWSDACLVREMQGLNHMDDHCAFNKNHCNTQLRAIYMLTAVQVDSAFYFAMVK